MHVLGDCLLSEAYYRGFNSSNRVHLRITRREYGGLNDQRGALRDRLHLKAFIARILWTFGWACKSYSPYEKVLLILRSSYVTLHSRRRQGAQAGAQGGGAAGAQAGRGRRQGGAGGAQGGGRGPVQGGAQRGRRRRRGGGGAQNAKPSSVSSCEAGQSAHWSGAWGLGRGAGGRGRGAGAGRGRAAGRGLGLGAGGLGAGTGHCGTGNWTGANASRTLGRCHRCCQAGQTEVNPAAAGPCQCCWGLIGGCGLGWGWQRELGEGAGAWGRGGAQGGRRAGADRGY